MSARAHIIQNRIYVHIEEAMEEVFERHFGSEPYGSALLEVVDWIDSNYRSLARWESVLHAEIDGKEWPSENTPEKEQQ
jgi:hypothetical protein